MSRLAKVTIGVDLGDKENMVCVLDSNGNRESMIRVPNTLRAMTRFFTSHEGAIVALEAGTHSPWVSRLLTSLGCKVLVGNPRKLRAIYESKRKSDVRDAEMLARMARFDSKLLYPIVHRGEISQADLAVIKARDALVQSRSALTNHVRGAVKSFGCRIPKCSTPCFHKRAKEHIPDVLQEALFPVLKQIESLNERIKEYDRRILMLSKERYPETEHLQQVAGVGPVTAATYVLTLEDPGRFKKSRYVGPFLGLVPKQDQSGECDKQLRISKAGNKNLRRLLVSCAQYILGRFGPDCNLRRYGLRIASRGGKAAKKRAVVAVARKLAVLLHRLWVTGEVYDPFYGQKTKSVGQAA